MYGWVQSIRDAVVGLTFPQTCALCGSPVESLNDGVTCHRCWDDLPQMIPGPRCPRCGLPTRVEIPSTASSCPSCRETNFSALRFVGPYAGALRANLLFLKDHPHLCQRLKSLILEVFDRQTILHSVEQVVPVPLHPLRLKERGFNQAALIGRVIARRTGVPLDQHVVTRVKHTQPHRAGMDAQARMKSVESAFAVNHPEKVRGRVILLVDDVFTTGSTLNACSRALIGAGVTAVNGFTVARVIQGSLVQGTKGHDGREFHP